MGKRKDNGRMVMIGTRVEVEDALAIADAADRRGWTQAEWIRRALQRVLAAEPKEKP